MAGENKIVEYVGPKGVRSSEADAYRFVHPQPGDPIRWPNGTFGRVDSYAGDGELHVCCELGSAFLTWDDQRRKPAVSISGGPFMRVALNELLSTYTRRAVPFWNWGDNMMGAHQGVSYDLVRPLFRYIGDRDDYPIRRKPKQRHLVVLSSGEATVAVGPFPSEDQARGWEQRHDPTAQTLASQFRVVALVPPDGNGDWRDRVDEAMRGDD